MSQIVLIATQAQRNALLEGGVLSEGAFPCVPPQGPFPAGPYCLDPDFLNPSALKHLDAREKKEILQSIMGGFLNGTFVFYLAILGEHADIPKEGPEPPLPREELEAVVRWHEDFQAIAREVLEERAAELYYIPIIINTLEIAASDWDLLERLLATRSLEKSKALPSFYMESLLDWGQDKASRGGIAYHSRFVWPIYVSRLLLAIASTDQPLNTLQAQMTGESNTQRARVLAWRGYDLLVTSEETVRRGTSLLCKATWEWLIREVDGPPPPVPQQLPTVNLPLVEPYELPTRGEWASVDPDDEIADLSDDQQKRHEKFPGQLHEKLGPIRQRHLALSRAKHRQSWQRAHQSLRHLVNTEKHYTNTSAPSAPPAEADWDEIAGHLDTLKQARKEAAEEGKLLTTMCRHFLPWQIRLVVCGVPVLLLACWVAYFIFGRGLALYFEMSVMIAAATAGVLAAVIGIHRMEFGGGKRATEAWRQIYLTGKIEGAFKNVMEAIKKLFGKAPLFFAEDVERSLLLRNRALVQRAVAIAEEGLGSPDDHRQEAPASQTATEARQREQRRELLRETRLYAAAEPAFTQDHASAIIEAQFSGAIDENSATPAASAQRFLEFCREQDPQHAGHFPFYHFLAFFQLVQRQQQRAMIQKFWGDLDRAERDKLDGRFREQTSETLLEKFSENTLSVNATGLGTLQPRILKSETTKDDGEAPSLAAAALRAYCVQIVEVELEPAPPTDQKPVVRAVKSGSGVRQS